MQDGDQPGSVISPGQSPTTAPPQSLSTPAPSQSTTVAPQVAQQSYGIEPQAQGPMANMVNTEEDALTWQVQSHPDAHSKSPAWYAIVVIAAIILTALVYFFAGKDIFVSVAVLIAGLGFVYLASRSPGNQQYALTNEGIYVGTMLRPFSHYKNFSTTTELGLPAIVLQPHKRFGSPLVVRLDPAHADEIVSVLSEVLPYEEYKPDAMDHLMRRIRL